MGKLLNLIGIDKSIAYSSGARIVQSVSGLLMVFFIGTYLTESEQGYYYTFSSLLALQIFFELGMNNIITQYVAYENASLSFLNGTFLGNPKNISRLASILLLIKKWYLLLCLLFFIVVGSVGYLYFSFLNYNDNISWEFPWLLVVLGTSLNLYLAPFTSFMMGLGYVKEISKISFIQQLLIPVISIFSLVLGLNLYILGISSCLTSLYIYIALHNYKLGNVFRAILQVKISEHISYRQEIFPYQWKIALSWINGYFIFQLFNPILFATEGPIIAGKVGMTMQIFNGIQAFSFSWLKTKVPLYSNLIAKNKFISLDRLFAVTLKQMVGVSSCLIILFYIFLIISKNCPLIAGTSFDITPRLLSYMPTLFLVIPLLANQFINSWATYLRCHKKEPFLISSTAAGITCLILIPLIGNYWGLYGVLGTYCLVTLLLLPCSYMIFVKKRREWHLL